jgi:hypothetical protein
MNTVKNDCKVYWQLLAVHFCLKQNLVVFVY